MPGHEEQQASTNIAADSSKTEFASLEARVFNDLVDYLYDQSATGRLTPSIGFTLCAIFFVPYTSWWTLLVILALQLGGTACSEYLRLRHARLDADADRTPWARAYTAASGLCGLSWGAAGVLWFVPGMPALQVVIVILIMGGATGSLVSRSPHLPALSFFLAGIGLPFGAALLLIGTPASLTIAFMAAMFTLGAFGWARGINRMYVREATARLRNNDLVRDLEIARDVAEARAEDAIDARRAAEVGERAKTQFLSTISHEVRTPLNGIQGMAQLLGESNLTDDQKDYLQVIRESSDNLRLILEDILEMSRMDAGPVKLDSAQFNPRAVAEQAVGILEPEARRKGLSLNILTMPEVPGFMTGDAARCRQVLLNILGNAVKFTDQGRVTVKLSVEQSSHHGDPEVLRFAVCDTGIGIEAAKLDALFTEFAQVDQSMTRRHGGGGLGLALVRRIVEQMDGAVGVRSTFGEGSEFWFDVPLKLAAQSTNPTRSLTDPSVMDQTKIAELEEVLGEVKSHEIIEGCLDAAWSLTEQIESARRRGDAEAMRMAAHDLKSTAGNVGMVALSERASVIDKAVRSGDLETAFDQAEHLPGETAFAQNSLLRVFPRYASGTAGS